MFVCVYTRRLAKKNKVDLHLNVLAKYVLFFFFFIFISSFFLFLWKIHFHLMYIFENRSSTITPITLELPIHCRNQI